jgi:hypothetical protein
MGQVRLRLPDGRVEVLDIARASSALDGVSIDARASLLRTSHTPRLC